MFFLVVRERLPEPLLYLSTYFRPTAATTTTRCKASASASTSTTGFALYLDVVRCRQPTQSPGQNASSICASSTAPAVRAVTRGAANALVDLAFEQPILHARVVERRLGVTRPAALAALRQLAKLEIITETSGGPRGQLRWRAQQVFAALLEE